MNYGKFRAQVRDVPVFYAKDAVKLDDQHQVMRNQLTRWQREGLIIQLKRGMYVLNKHDQKIVPTVYFIAHQVYSPSYVSMEYAMQYYDLIPERVVDITCVTTRKTMCFVNDMGKFVYRHIKLEAFGGFLAVKDSSGFSFFIAEPEKAIIDFLYLNLGRFGKDIKEMMSDSYRFQNLETLKPARVMELSRMFDSKKLLKAADILCQLINVD